MTTTLHTLFDALLPDDWRTEVGFTAEVSKAQDRLFTSTDDDTVVFVLNEWLHRHQPCIFGRFAARNGLLSYCILREEDLARDDEEVREKIQNARLRWTAAGFEGAKSGFIVFVLSPRIAHARPDGGVQALAQRLCSLYLLSDVQPDTICLDEVFLEKPGRAARTWKWFAGVNYFSAQADLRWWQDHRIPGGMAFSVNSVGHLVKAGKIAKAMKGLAEALDDVQDGWPNTKLDSLPDALLLAMRTIANAASGPFGPATRLIPVEPGVRSGLPPCPIANLPGDLQGTDYTQYRGRYHTDYTLPSEYFQADVGRLAGATEYALDFTYLFDASVSNPDHWTMGEGRLIRGDNVARTGLKASGKRLLSRERTVPIEREARLRLALERYGRGP
jgi:hypothetical protein